MFDARTSALTWPDWTLIKRRAEGSSGSVEHQGWKWRGSGVRRAASFARGVGRAGGRVFMEP
jgi:hypothetical protein